MDWTRLSSEELRAFLELNSVRPSSNQIDQANQLFGQAETGYTEPVVDLYLVKLLQDGLIEVPQVYTGQEILELSPDKQQQFAQIMSLEPNDPHLLPRIIRIIRWLGFLDPTCEFNRWRNFNLLRESCFQTKQASLNLQRKLRGDITPDSLVLFHYSDAVKFAQTEAEAEQHNIFPPGYFNLTYAQRVELFQDMNSPLNPRRWSRQQWPHNTIEYCYQNNIKLVYVQSDLIYCQYPSMFAEAMCGGLYFESESIEGMAYRFAGHNTVLYNVGEHGVAYDLIKAMQPSQEIMIGYFGSPIRPVLDPTKRMFDIDILRNDLEWALMSDSFRNSMYQLLLKGRGPRLESSYVYFPWAFLEPNFNWPIRPVQVKTGGSMVGITKQTITVTYLNEINIPSSIRPYFKTRRQFFEPTWKIPLSYIFGQSDDNSIYISSRLDVVQPIYISSDVRFEGTYDHPRILVNDREVNPEVVRALVSLNL